MGKLRNFFLVTSFLLIIFNCNTDARQSYDFNIGDKVHVLSDKAFRKTKDNVFEAVGNVIITHKQDALYGEKASVSFESGDVNVVGNVRFVGTDMTIYGSALDYNFNNKILSINNARVLSDNYVILGKNITRESSTELRAENAEYTTCRDCPESWSIFGRQVSITLGEYIRIKHAFIKVRGVVVMYFPYIILPIKKNRETGLLFPSFGLNVDKGFRYQQPFFWAINDSADMTIVPSVFGKRGYGSEYQYRQVLSDQNWFEINSMFLNDEVYVPGVDSNDKSGSNLWRHLSDYEHHSFFSDSFNHHFYYNAVNDLDMVRDFSSFSGSKVYGPEFGGGGYFDFVTEYFNFSVEGDFNRNLLFSNARGFDHRYVQVLPEVKLSAVPFNIFRSKHAGIKSLDVEVEADYTVFKQNHTEEGAFIRNAHRLNASPSVIWNLGNLGPVAVKTSAIFDYQSYRFPYEVAEKTLTKSGYVYETEASITLQKIFGVSYRENLPRKKIKFEEEVTKEKPLLGDLKSFSSNVSTKSFEVQKSSYKHTQEYKLKHYYLGSQSIKGNQKFQNQIKVDNGKKGLFDPLDVLRSQEFQLTNDVSRTSLPLNNTVELQWNNSVIKKKAKVLNAYYNKMGLRDNFDYSVVSYFNVSQGYDFNVREGDFYDHLTRLYLSTGFSLDSYTFSLDEYYYHTTKEHIFTMDIKKTFSRGDVGAGVKYNSFKTPIEKFVNANTSFAFNDMIKAGVDWVYDIEKDRTNKTIYNLTYTPPNNCWKVEFNHEKNITESKFGFNFLINFNNNVFTSLSGLGGG